MLALACEVSELELPGFVHQLSEDRGGLTLVYMHHADSLRSGTSYQNDTRISLRDHVEVELHVSRLRRSGWGLTRCSTKELCSTTVELL